MQSLYVKRSGVWEALITGMTRIPVTRDSDDGSNSNFVLIKFPNLSQAVSKSILSM